MTKGSKVSFNVHDGRRDGTLVKLNHYTAWVTVLTLVGSRVIKRHIRKHNVQVEN